MPGSKDHRASSLCAMLRKNRIRPASRGDPTLLVLTLPEHASAFGDEVDVFAMPLEFRQGGMLLAIPKDTLSAQALADGQSGSEEILFGPNSVFASDLLDEGEDLNFTVPVGVEVEVLVVDVSDDVLALCREYDPVTDTTATILGYSHEHPASLPEHTRLLVQVNSWLLSRTDDRTGFYTAQDDQEQGPKASNPPGTGVPPGKKPATAKRVSNAAIAEQLTALSAQLQLLSQRQDRLESSGPGFVGHAPEPFVGPTPKLPAVSAQIQNPSGMLQTGQAKALNLIGPPPRTRAAPAAPGANDAVQDEPYDPLQPTAGDPESIASAIAQQSTAITALVAHLTSQSGDVMGDFLSTGQSSSTTRGVQRREKMQNDLATGSSCYFFQLMQQLHRRLHPSKPVPQREEELQGLSVLHYLERQGGYRNQREMGLVAWVLGHALHAAAAGDFRHTKEVLALLMVAVEQSVLDRGDWSLAFMLTLMEEPPLQMFQERAMTLAQNAKPFGPLVPPQWTAVCLSYLKDLEVLANKKVETAKRAAKPPPANPSAGSTGEPEKEESPRRKPRFPKKPKAKAPADA